jgi:hypothetical protein
MGEHDIAAQRIEHGVTVNLWYTMPRGLTTSPLRRPTQTAGADDTTLKGRRAGFRGTRVGDARAMRDPSVGLRVGDRDRLSTHHKSGARRCAADGFNRQGAEERQTTRPRLAPLFFEPRLCEPAEPRSFAVFLAFFGDLAVQTIGRAEM